MIDDMGLQNEGELCCLVTVVHMIEQRRGLDHTFTKILASSTSTGMTTFYLP